METCSPTGDNILMMPVILCKCRVMFNGMRKAFPGLRIVSEEFEEYDGPVTLPRLDEEGLREDVSLKFELVHSQYEFFRRAYLVDILSKTAW